MDSSILWIEDNMIHVKRYNDDKFISHDLYDIEDLNCLHIHGDIKTGIFLNNIWKKPIRDFKDIEKWTYESNITLLQESQQ